MIPVLIVSLTLNVLLILIFVACVKDLTKVCTQAIKRGYAEWDIDRNFRWKDTQ